MLGIDEVSKTVPDAACRDMNPLNGLRFDPGGVSVEGDRCGAHIAIGREQFAGTLAPGRSEIEYVGGSTLTGGAADLYELSASKVAS